MAGQEGGSLNSAAWPLVGRVKEITRVRSAMDGEAGGVLFAGPAGVGKTRLAFECLGFAAERGYRTVHVRANRSSATIPYGAFAPLLPPATTRGAESRGDLLRYFAEAILDDADDRPLLLVVDDAQDLDEASAALLLHLVLQGGVFPVVTLRTGEPAPESVVMLWKDELLARIDVSPLSVQDIAMLAADVLGGPVEGGTIHSLWTRSEGNALFLRELIISAVASGALADSVGIWRLQGSLAASPRLTELVRMRLGALDDDERHTLEVVSVGEPIPLTTLEELADGARVERLEARGLVDVETEGAACQVRMAHPLYGEELRAELPSRRRERICRMLADAVEHSGELSAEDALRVAVWRLESGDTEHTELLMTAAHQAAFAFDFRLARRLARAAWDAGAGLEAGHVLGAMLDTLGEHEEDEDVLRAVEAEASNDEERVQIAEARVERLEARGLVDVETEGAARQVRMAHPLYGEELRAELPSRRHERICRMLADAVEHSGDLSAEDALRVAVWRLESGDTEHTELLMTAAHQAAFAFDFRLARRLARAAWDAGAGLQAGHLLGAMLDTLGEHEEAEDVLRAVEAEASTDEERVQIAEARVGNLFRGLGRASEAEDVGLAAERAVSDPEVRAELVTQRAIHALFAADMNEALALSEPLLDEAIHPGRVVVKAALAAGPALALSGRTADAIRVADRAFELRIQLGDQVQMAGPGVYLVARALALAEAGRLEEAKGTAQAGYDGAVESQVLEGQGWFTLMLGRICLLQGRVAMAARWFREAAVLWGELVHPSAGWGYGGLAHALTLAGDVDGAESAIDDLDAEPPTPIHMMDVDIERGRAWYTWFRGEHARALGILRAAADFGIEGGQFALAAGAFHDLARLGEASEAAEHLERVAEHVDGDLMPARLAHATALAKGDPAGLDHTSEAFEELGGWLFAAEAANQASMLYEREGLRRRASAAAQRSSALAERCEGARSPALDTGPQPVALTKREREVATLAARGLTSREIAETIVVSTRTVENHLQRAYEKLGVSGRLALAEALKSTD